jgi:DNA-directed RNA polymerase subunit omega
MERHDASPRATSSPYTMMSPQMEELVEQAGSRFALVTLSAMRASEISDYYSQLGDGLGTIVPPQVVAVSRKPLSIAMEEIEVGKIAAVPLPTDEELAAGDVAPSGTAARRRDAAARGTRREPYASLWKIRPIATPRAPKHRS